MGTVSLLSGQPKDGVSIEARSESKGYYEETVTDSSGSYRLRGLHPGATYVIKIAKRVRLGSTKIERASPEFVTVTVGLIYSFLLLFNCLSDFKIHYLRLNLLLLWLEVFYDLLMDSTWIT